MSRTLLEARPVQRLIAVFAAFAIAAGVSVVFAVEALAFPPDVPSKAQVQSELNSLRVRGEGSMSGYDRDKFPHWEPVAGWCNTREEVLKRDGRNVDVGTNCYPTSGTWWSHYDGVTWSDPSDVDIDHVVPLAEAWRSGARYWTTSRREAFANDLDGPQLIAVTDNVNQSKGDRDPSEWKPPRYGAWCAYSKFWIHTKYRWNLHLQSSEKSALQSMLNRCSY